MRGVVFSLRVAMGRALILCLLCLVIIVTPGEAREGQILLRGGTIIYGELVHDFLLLNTDPGLVEVRSAQVTRLRPDLIELQDGRVIRGRIVGGIIRVRSQGQELLVSLTELLEFRILVSPQIESQSQGVIRSSPQPHETPPHSSSPVGLERLFEDVSSSIVTLSTTQQDGSVGQGTGFVVSGGFIATNYHVVNNAVRATASFSDRSPQAVRYLAAFNPEWDLALLVVDQLPADARPLPLELERSPRVGQRIAIIGSPMGLSLTLTDGLISAIRGDGPDQVLQLTAPISPGSSGSPVLSLDARVVGVATLYVREGQNLNFAIPSRKLQALIGRVRKAGAASWSRLPLGGQRQDVLSEPRFNVPSYRAPTRHEQVLNDAYLEVLPVLDLVGQSRIFEEQFGQAATEIDNVFAELGRRQFVGDALYRRALALVSEMQRLHREDERILQQVSILLERFVEKLQELPMHYVTEYLRIKTSSTKVMAVAREATAKKRQAIDLFRQTIVVLREGRPGRFEKAAQLLRRVSELSKQYQSLLTETERMWNEVASGITEMSEKVPGQKSYVTK